MTSKDKIARCKLSLLEFATDLQNVSRACKVMGYPVSSYTRFAVTSRRSAPKA